MFTGTLFRRRHRCELRGHRDQQCDRQWYLYRASDGKTFSAGKNLIFSDSLKTKSTVHFDGLDGTVIPRNRQYDNAKTVVNSGARTR